MYNYAIPNNYNRIKITITQGTKEHFVRKHEIDAHQFLNIDIGNTCIIYDYDYCIHEL